MNLPSLGNGGEVGWELGWRKVLPYLFYNFYCSKWFEPWSISSLSSVIVRVSVVLKRTGSVNFGEANLDSNQL